MKNLPTLALLVLIVCLGLAILLVLRSTPDPVSSTVDAPAGTSASPTPAPTPFPATVFDGSPSSFSAQDVESAPEPEVDAISKILANEEMEFDEAVSELLKVLPGLSEEGQTEAAHHIANLSDDETVKRWSGMLVRGQLPEPAAEVLFHDMLNRPDEVLYPTLTAIADQKEHAQRTDSVEILEVLFEPPPQGVSWQVWVANQLKEEQQP